MNTLTLEQIIERLTEWKENIDVDIKAHWVEQENKADYTRQSICITQCIGMGGATLKSK